MSRVADRIAFQTVFDNCLLCSKPFYTRFGIILTHHHKPQPYVTTPLGLASGLIKRFSQMTNRLEGLDETTKWHLMVAAATRGTESQGYAMERVPGRGLSNVWTITKNGKTVRAAIRTTRDRWFAFPPLAKGTKWKTLDDVDVVIVASVDSHDEPENVEVFIFPADEVRKRFSAAYAARAKAGQHLKDNFGMWVALDIDSRGIPASIGSGIVNGHKRVAVYAIEELIAANGSNLAVSDDDVDEAEQIAGVEDAAPRYATIAEVMAWARKRVAEIAGVKVEAVKLELKVEY